MAIGNMFANGSIVPQNLPEAKKIFAALAQENIPKARESLAAVDKMIAEQKKHLPKKLIKFNQNKKLLLELFMDYRFISQLV